MIESGVVSPAKEPDPVSMLKVLGTIPLLLKKLMEVRVTVTSPSMLAWPKGIEVASELPAKSIVQATAYMPGWNSILVIFIIFVFSLSWYDSRAAMDAPRCTSRVSLYPACAGLEKAIGTP
jgi:hypothetical protein